MGYANPAVPAPPGGPPREPIRERQLPERIIQPPLKPLDPDSPRGIAAANALSEVLGDVLTRLRREGNPPDICGP